jgi:hypothetical protein
MEFSDRKNFAQNSSYKNHIALTHRVVTHGEIYLLEKAVPDVWEEVEELKSFDLNDKSFCRALQRRLKALRQQMGATVIPTKRTKQAREPSAPVPSAVDATDLPSELASNIVAPPRLNNNGSALSSLNKILNDPSFDYLKITNEDIAMMEEELVRANERDANDLRMLEDQMEMIRARRIEREFSFCGVIMKRAAARAAARMNPPHTGS